MLRSCLLSYLAFFLAGWEDASHTYGHGRGMSYLFIMIIVFCLSSAVECRCCVCFWGGGVVRSLSVHFVIWMVLVACCLLFFSCEEPMCRQAVDCGAGATCTSGECVCAAGLQRCVNECVDVTKEPSHCGKCGTQCAAGESCVGGVCTVIEACPAPFKVCSGACVYTDNDERHCGACGKVCAIGAICEEGTCRCRPGLLACGGVCVNPQADRSHCGGCGRVCDASEVCSKSRCVAGTCPANTPTNCLGGCVDTSTNPQHCGGCGQLCAPGQLCQKGVCVCPPTLSLCGGRCVDVMNNQLHCGKCGNTCPDGRVCGGGRCVSSCPDATGTSCLGGCVDTNTHPLHCGGCGKPCPTGESCLAGKCDGSNPLGLCQAGQTQACYSGRPGTEGVGICKGGTRTCVNGVFGTCEGEQLELSEQCNGADDDCDGQIDNGSFCVVLYAGTGTRGFKNGPAKQAEFASPNGLAVDAKKQLYIADGGNNCIRYVDTQGEVKTYAGQCGSFGYKDGPANQALLNNPNSIVFDDKGNLYIADVGNSRIRKVDTKGVVSTVAGDGTRGYADGIGIAAKFNSAYGLAWGPKDNKLYVADARNHAIRVVSPTGEVGTWAGGPTKKGYKDGRLADALFNTPSRLRFDSAGNLYVGDTLNQRVRKIDPQGNVTTVAGSGYPNFWDHPNPLTGHLHDPTGIAFDTQGRMYIADSANGRIRKVEKNGLQTVLGTGPTGSDFQPGRGTLAYIGLVYSILFVPPNSLYIASFGQSQIYRMTTQ